MSDDWAGALLAFLVLLLPMVFAGLYVSWSEARRAKRRPRPRQSNVAPPGQH
ncbi:MAG TPA: hypothetical protein VHA82_06235 [Ramlibacter sp.]|uniref:hypothetical protein n=1 Tax=Ramlibacter sp. TaxID=1917967 RepID=UPI002D169A80|nr:hypothetical protein [Ramlibacter sp.]HVZ43392.1 hypothetical protein [Ramlibacter sp.]